MLTIVSRVIDDAECSVGVNRPSSCKRRQRATIVFAKSFCRTQTNALLRCLFFYLFYAIIILLLFRKFYYKKVQSCVSFLYVTARYHVGIVGLIYVYTYYDIKKNLPVGS